MSLRKFYTQIRWHDCRALLVVIDEIFCVNNNENKNRRQHQKKRTQQQYTIAKRKSSSLAAQHTASNIRNYSVHKWIDVAACF